MRNLSGEFGYDRNVLAGIVVLVAVVITLPTSRWCWLTDPKAGHSSIAEETGGRVRHIRRRSGAGGLRPRRDSADRSAAQGLTVRRCSRGRAASDLGRDALTAGRLGGNELFESEPSVEPSDCRLRSLAKPAWYDASSSEAATAHRPEAWAATNAMFAAIAPGVGKSSSWLAASYCSGERRGRARRCPPGARARPRTEFPPARALPRPAGHRRARSRGRGRPRRGHLARAPGRLDRVAAARTRRSGTVVVLRVTHEALYDWLARARRSSALGHRDRRHPDRDRARHRRRPRGRGRLCHLRDRLDLVPARRHRRARPRSHSVHARPQTARAGNRTGGGARARYAAIAVLVFLLAAVLSSD